MIYFDTPLQNRVHDLFHESLLRLGILALGPKESLAFTSHADDYEVLNEGERLYRKVR
jgi:chemotaxis protein methyltransferase CheR